MADLENDGKEASGSATYVGVVVNNQSDSNEEHPDISALKALFKVTLETRNFEIAMLVQRNNFFMIFQGVLLAGLIQSSHAKPVVSFMVCFAGMLVSVFQVQMAAGAKFWQEYWEQALFEVENRLLKSLEKCEREIALHLFHDDTSIYEKYVRERLNSHGHSFTNRLIMKRYSVSRVPIYVSIGLALIWFVLILCTLRGYQPFSIPSFIVGF
ncbi:hypothetical protein [uncultured Deefgea sp.]|uniref:RipA family octameric membrane protein n=1 Tax=uncultured Deefgea sp. TaxID=1304914 RepID=UPI00261080FF|nr:hypothetical protein [uncultured Deefgea sp.]